MRTNPLSATDGLERWISGEDKTSSYEVSVRRGKPVDIISLKQNVLDDFAAQIEYIRTTRSRLFDPDHTESVKACPICAASSDASNYTVSIYGGRYHQCSGCSHYFVINRPSKQKLDQFYASDKRYSATYTDKRITETRLRQVAMPKAEWAIGEFARVYGRRPLSILDVGAGGGHFVYACAELGIHSRGIELSDPSREFCKNAFNIELAGEDFVSSWKAFSGVEMITFWGVLEHVPNPMELLAAAHRAISPGGMVIASVPRWDSMSTAVQLMFSDAIVRHLDPLGHISVFTDSSIATAFETSKFAPVSAWYFGMDAYELVMQLSHALNGSGDAAVNTLARYIPSLQTALDRAQLTDEIALAGTPNPGASRELLAPDLRT